MRFSIRSLKNGSQISRFGNVNLEYPEDLESAEYQNMDKRAMTLIFFFFFLGKYILSGFSVP